MKKFLSFILGSLVLIFLVLIYSRFIGTSSLKTHELVVNTNIYESYNGLKIVHFSDLHYKKIITEEQVEKLVKEINLTKPDLVLFTGDLLDDLYEIPNSDINFLIKELKKIEAKYGKYAVLGDHDYSQQDIVFNIYIQSDFTVLNNSSVMIYNESNEKIILTGLGSYLKDDFKIDDIVITDLSLYQIVLVHEPDMVLDITKYFPNTSLVLAGHSINGSINIPFIKNYLLPDGAKKYYQEFYDIGNTKLYISNGIGVNNINFRLFNAPSFNLYRLHKDN